MSEPYIQSALLVGDLYILKAGVAVKARDVLVLTGNTVNGLLEVDVMGSSYTPDQVIGISQNELSATITYREITVLVKGASLVKVAQAVTGNERLQGASDINSETFSGDNTAQQTVYVGNLPIVAVTSLTEDTPTVLTRVTLPAVPTTDEYSLDDDTGELIIGGTSVSGTDNYTLIYTTDGGRLESFAEWVEVLDLTVTTNVGTLDSVPDDIEYVESVTGTSTGAMKIITQGTVAQGEVKLDRANKTLTFHATDAVTVAAVRYKPATAKSCARALQSKAVGELARVYFEGVSD